MIIKFFEETKDNNEHLLGTTTTNIIPRVGELCMFDYFDLIDEFNIYKVKRIAYVYTQGEENPQIDITLIKDTDNEMC